MPGRFRSLCLVAALAVTTPASACGPYPFDTWFWHDDWPGVTSRQLVNGELGVFDAAFDSTRVFVAWRHLAGLGLAEADRERLVEMMDRDPWAGWGQPSGVDIWRQAREAVAGSEGDPIWTRREGAVDEGSSIAWDFFENCLDDAFETATATLEARAAEYGTDSPWVEEWLRGQDKVFANCEEGEHTPPPEAPEWPQWLKHDRAYQIAAAMLYSERYDEAAERFAAIAETDSPWATVAAYLVGRALGRAGRYGEAIEQYRRILDDPAASDYHRSAAGLVDHLLYRHDPDTLRREVAGRLAEPTFDDRLEQDLGDFVSLTSSRTETGRQGAFFKAMRGWMPPSEVVEHWRGDKDGDTGDLWLWAALLRANARALERPYQPTVPALPADTIEELLATPQRAAGRVGAVTEAYHRARLLLDVGKLDEAVALLERTLAGELGAVGLGDRNRLAVQRLRAATSLDEVVRFGAMPPLIAGTNYGGGEPLEPPDFQIPGWDGGPVWHHAATLPLNGLSPTRLAGLAASVDDELLRRATLRTAWTRAVVLGDAAATVELGSRLAQSDPKLASALATLDTASGEELPFVATTVLLRHPGLHPDVHWGVPRTSEVDEMESAEFNWWCEGSGFYLPGSDEISRLDLDGPEDRASREQMQSLPSAPNWMGDVVLAYADAHPNDPRVPEALHRVVRATRRGCKWGPTSFGEVSKAAFDRLHRRYSRSPWTEKTPYWFE